MGVAQRPVSSVNRVREQVAEDLFTDREEPRKAFWDLYNSMKPGEYSVLTYYGVGGIGKTSLLKKLGREMDEKLEKGELDHTFFSFEGKASKEEFLYTLSRNMILSFKGKLEFPLFEAAVLRIAGEQGKDVSQFEKKVKESLLGNPLLDTAISVGGKFLPFLGTAKTAAKILEYLFGLAGKSWDEKKIINGEYGEDYLELKSLSSDELGRRLQEYFVMDVFDSFSERDKPYVVFLDGYENIVSLLSDGEMSRVQDEWIYRPMTGLINIPNILWVIAGREKLNWNSEDLPDEHQHRVGDLSKTDCCDFFEKASIPENLRLPLYKLTNGTPVFMDLCVKTYRSFIKRGMVPGIEDFGRDTNELAKRYLRDMDREEQALMVMFAWFPNVFDMEMVNGVLEKLRYGAFRLLVNDLLKLSLFERVSDGYRLHETFRRVTREFAGRENADEVSKAVFSFLKERALNFDRATQSVRWFWQFFDMLDDEGFEKEVSFEEADKLVGSIYDELTYGYEYFDCIDAIEKFLRFASNSVCPAKEMVMLFNIRNQAYEQAGYTGMRQFAEETYSFALEYLGDDDYETLLALNNLAALVDVSEFDEAEKLTKKCLEMSSKINGPDSRLTILALSNLGMLYVEAGNFQEAYRYLTESVEKSTEAHGEDDPDTLHLLNCLAGAYYYDDDYKKAYELFNECYEKRVRVLGKEHPDTINSCEMMVECLDRLNTGKGPADESSAESAFLKKMLER